MPKETPVLLTRDPRGVATVTLNRPQVGNAYNEAMLQALIGGLDRLRADPAVPRAGACAARAGISPPGPISTGWPRSPATRRSGPSRPRWPPPAPCRS